MKICNPFSMARESELTVSQSGFNKEMHEYYGKLQLL